MRSELVQLLSDSENIHRGHPSLEFILARTWAIAMVGMDARLPPKMAIKCL